MTAGESANRRHGKHPGTSMWPRPLSRDGPRWPEIRLTLFDPLFNTLWEYGLDTGNVCEWILSATGMKRGVSCRTKKNIHQLFKNQLSQHLLFDIFSRVEMKQRCFSRHGDEFFNCFHVRESPRVATSRLLSGRLLGDGEASLGSRHGKSFKTIFKAIFKRVQNSS